MNTIPIKEVKCCRCNDCLDDEIYIEQLEDRLIIAVNALKDIVNNVTPASWVAIGALKDIQETDNG